MVERAAAQVYRPSPPLSPASFDFAIAEIAARQNELDASAPRQLPPRSAPPTAPAMAPPMPTPADASACPAARARIFPRSSAICSRSPARSRRCSVPTGSSNRSPRSAANWPKSATPSPRRCRAGRSNRSKTKSARCRAASTTPARAAATAKALAGIERALGEIREVLRSLTPAEQLAGYDEAIRNLGAKLDLILRANDDPSTVQQLEGAIAALRAIVSNVASNDALVRLSDDVRTLSSKVDQLARSGDNSDSFAILEQRIAALTSTLESRERPAAADNSEQLEGALRALSDRLDRMPVGNDNASAFAHLEQRVSYLLERLEASTDHRSGNLGRVEDGLQDILRHLENQHASFAALAERPPQRAPQPRRFRPGRYRQARIVRHPLQPDRDRPPHPGFARSRSQHARPCGRPAGDDRRRSARGSRPAPVAPPPEAEPSTAGRACRPRRQPAARRRMPPQPKPELPNPAAAQEHFAAAPREFQAAPPPMPPLRRGDAARHQRNPRAAYGAAARRDRAGPAAGSSARAGHAADAAATGLAVGAHRGFRKRHQRNSGQPRSASRSAHRASLPPRAAPPRPPRPRRPCRRQRPARDVGQEARRRQRPRKPRPSPPRSARCWSARAWS